MEKDVYVMKDSIKYLEFVELVTQILTMMAVIVFVITDITEIEIIVINAMILVEHVQEQVLMSVSHALISVMN